ncbi:unnamed protein product, partial [Mesorhabditis spiculigera]
MVKAAQIKQWVVHRLKELEEQNERLRLQNLRCTTQLQMLKSMSEQTRRAKQQHNKHHALMSHSITGALPVCRELDNRTSDDSGLTSDEHPDRLCQLPADAMSRSIAGESTPKTLRKKAPRQNSADCGGTVGGATSPAPSSDGSPIWEQPRPVPTPRKPRNTLLERDSLNSFADEYEFDCEEETFDEVVESPVDSPRRKGPEYVNLADFCAIRDDKNIYSDIIKPSSSSASHHPPAPPQHRLRPWESKILDAADQCLAQGSGLQTTAETTDYEGPSSVSPYQVSRISDNRASSSGRRSNGASSGMSIPRVFSNYSTAEVDIDPYESPSRQLNERRSGTGIRTSMIPNAEAIEKAGYWCQLSESRLKSLKRRFVELRNGTLTFYRTQKNMARDEEPLLRIPVSELKSVTRIPGNPYALQLMTATQRLQYQTDSEKGTEEWVSLIGQAIRGTTLRELASRTSRIEATISGVVQRVKCGHSKRLHAALAGQKLLFFKNPEDTVPTSFVELQGARVCEKQKGPSEESSGSSDEQSRTERPPQKRKEYTVSIEVCNDDPLYIVFRSAEEKERWMYFLKAASGDASLCGTPFELLVQRMLVEGAGPDSQIWTDLLLVSRDDPRDLMTTVQAAEKKKALEIAKACHLFVAVLMRPCAVQYHIDLAQNILSTGIQLDWVRNELYAQMIRLTSGSMEWGLQGWKLLALALPLFLPKQYALLWLLRRHISRWAAGSGDEAGLAGYCSAALERSLQTGGRFEGPSRLEATSILTRDPTATTFPHSISVKLPNGDYQVVEFDGSTEVGQCLSSLCLKLGMRPALLSGYALYIDHPTNGGLQLLKGKQKLCDCLTLWERRERDVKRGRVAVEVARLELRLRHYWPHLAHTETMIERGFLAWRSAEEIVEGRVPLGPQLAEDIMALYGQLYFGDLDGSTSQQQFDYVTSRFYPRKMLDVANMRTLRASLDQNWRQMTGSSEAECIRLILQVLRKWPLFGSSLWEAGLRTSNERRVVLALHDTGLHILDRKQLDPIRSIPFDSLVAFGAFHSDFMLTVERVLPPDCHPEETPKERLTFSMELCQIEQLTTHLAEYIRCQKLVFNVSK